MKITPVKRDNHKDIIDILMRGAKSVMTKEDVIDRLEYLLFMLTNKQKSCLYNKLNRCSNYIDLINRGMEMQKIKSIIKRKHSLKRQNMEIVCKPCDNYIRYKK